jgi:S1-C subfamily serine protease
VDGADQISVELTDKLTFDAKVIGSDAASDLALLKIEANNLPVLPLGDSDKVRVGDVGLAVGNPLGIGETVTAGIISAKGGRRVSAMAVSMISSRPTLPSIKEIPVARW